MGIVYACVYAGVLTPCGAVQAQGLFKWQGMPSRVLPTSEVKGMARPSPRATGTMIQVPIERLPRQTHSLRGPSDTNLTSKSLVLPLHASHDVHGHLHVQQPRSRVS